MADESAPARDSQSRPIGTAARLARVVVRLATLAEPSCRGWLWIPTSISVGSVPFLVSFAFGVAGHQLVSGVLLVAICLTSVRADRALVGMAMIGIAFLSHSSVVIAAAVSFPDQAAAVLPDAKEYWELQIQWIETGQNHEYDLWQWVPAHFMIFGGTTIFTLSSFGAMTFFQGFYQVDLMNYYNAQLITASVNQPIAMATGWHIWSLLRGIGYLFLTFELISFAYQLWTREIVSTWLARRRRWLVGLSFLLADGVVKATMLEIVRLQLFSNLQ